jgi:hypothetical protein
LRKTEKNLLKVIKSAALKTLGKIMRRNRRKCLKMWDDRMK